MTLAHGRGARRASPLRRHPPRRQRQQGLRHAHGVRAPEFDPNSKSRLIAITLDEDSIRRGNTNIEHEREVAIFDILEANSFVLEGRDDGPYTLDLSIVEDRLVFAVGHQSRPRATPSPTCSRSRPCAAS